MLIRIVFFFFGVCCAAAAAAATYSDHVSDKLNRALRESRRPYLRGHESFNERRKKGSRRASAAESKRRKAGAGECVVRSASGGRRLVPSGEVLRREAGVIQNNELECKEMSTSDLRLSQTCCRPKKAAVDRYAELFSSYWKSISRTVEAEVARGEKYTSLDVRKAAITEWRCLPSLIIAGAQKCGSTALTGLLLHHPQLRFGRNKELHYFDKNESQCMGIVPYLLAFPRVQSLKLSHLPFATAEATPFYLAATQSCQRIAAQLPNAKLIVLVRDPIERAKSEYSMKVRRIDDQDNFFQLLHSAQVIKRLAECLIYLGGRNITRGLNECGPKELVSNAKFPLFRNSMLRQLRSIHASSPFLTLTTWLSKCFMSRTMAEDIPHEARLDFDIYQKFFKHSDHDIENTPHYLEFSTSACYPEASREQLAGSLAEVLLEEISLYESCIQTNFPQWPLQAPPTPQDAVIFLSTCVKVRTGISIQYVYRGLYAGQLQRCQFSIPQSNILVLENQFLRTQPQSSLDSIAQFLGLNHFSYDTSLFDPTSSALQDAIRNKYPTFEKTGWRLQGSTPSSSDDLDPSALTQIVSFFAPHNELFFSMMNQRFDHWLSPDNLPSHLRLMNSSFA